MQCTLITTCSTYFMFYNGFTITTNTEQTGQVHMLFFQYIRPIRLMSTLFCIYMAPALFVANRVRELQKKPLLICILLMSCPPPILFSLAIGKLIINLRLCGRCHESLQQPCCFVSQQQQVLLNTVDHSIPKTRQKIC